jgi:SSS family solute:Na+ symporter
LYWKKATKAGALASLWTGVLTSLFCMVFLHKAEAAPIGICKALFGKDVLIAIGQWPSVDPIVFALPLSTVAIILVSMLSKKQ